MRKLRNLQPFYLHSKKLEPLPREIVNLMNLKVFFLSNNRITRISKEICSLDKLKKMNVCLKNP